MAYNYGPPPGAFGARQPPFAPPGGPMPVPGMGMPPPGFGAPGMDNPPGMASQSPGGMQGQFQPPANMPNINFNAPVIRLGVEGQRDERGGGRGGGRDRDGRGSNAESMGNRGRAGLGSDMRGDRNLDRDRQQIRENMMAMQPPTREEVARTIFVGGLGKDAMNDEMLDSVLRSAGKLRRWTRAKDADEMRCKFGFAEYEDVESLEAAAEIFRDCEVPLFNADGSVQKEGEEGEVKKAKLHVVVDEASMKYIEEWKGRRKEDENTRQFRIDSCKEELQSTITSIINSNNFVTNGSNGVNGADANGDTTMADANGDTKGESIEVVTIPGSLDDELADIPPEMRATVAEEIKAFRERSHRRDIERLRQEEEMEREERARAGGAARANRLGSPPPNGAPAGPASTTNGIPVGPRGNQGVQGAPAGPKGYRGAQLPSDYVNGVVFVPGAGRDGRGVRVSLNREDEDAEESDEELERRRKERRDSDLNKEYEDLVRRWQTREKQRGMAQERERNRQDAEKRSIERAKEDMLDRLSKWNDDDEAARGKELYYRDRSAWLRQRGALRDQEREEDKADRLAEERENADTRRREAEAKGQADDFLGSMGVDLQTPAAEQARPGAGFKISLGSAAAKTRQPAAPAGNKRVIENVEGLLEDEEDAAASGLKRPELKPLQDTSTVPVNGSDLTDEEKTAARQQLAGEIPTETDALFAHPIKWDALTPPLVDAQIRPFVERKVVEYLGVQEDLIVDAVIDGIRDRKKPTDIREDLEGPLEDEAEVLVKKVWRLLVFWGECESRGLS